MDIEIVGTESLGVRGLCCFVRTEKRGILIDPGVALGYTRYGLLPHPFQVAVAEKVQEKIVERWSEATDIVISHFHGDHVPLVDANPYQLDIERVRGLNPNVTIWSKTLPHLSPLEMKRADSLSSVLGNREIEAEGKKDGAITFSRAVFHGDKDDTAVTVMMTRIEGDDVFVHASDIQLLNTEAVSQILDWMPQTLLVGGPPLYLSKRLSKNQMDKAWNNAVRICREVDTPILDHHLMRDLEGVKWIERLSLETGKRVMCGADFMKKPRTLLEAGRKRSYEDMPVPAEWHEKYAKGIVGTDPYWMSAAARQHRSSENRKTSS